jgi:branched-chain amino acid transport system permease protein
LSVHKLLPLLALLLNVLLLGSALAGARKSHRHYVFALLAGAFAVWNLGVFGLRGSADPATALIWERFLHYGVIPIPVLFYHYVLAFLDQRRNPLLIGGYAVGILSFHGIGNGFVHFAAALVAASLAAAVIGFVSLRTSGVYFIMITLAFAQMAFFIARGLSRYGADDGLTIYKRSSFGGVIDLSNRVQFYYLCLGCLFGGIYLIWRIINSRFGMVVQGIRSNEQRMQAIGYHANRYRLVCFVISGTICGLAGALLANNTDFISPAGMYWTRSGELMVMVVFGGMGSLFGPVLGTIVFLLLEEVLSQFTEYWALIMGPLLLLIVLFARGGIMGVLGRFSRG